MHGYKMSAGREPCDLESCHWDAVLRGHFLPADRRRLFFGSALPRSKALLGAITLILVCTYLVSGVRYALYAPATSNTATSFDDRSLYLCPFFRSTLRLPSRKVCTMKRPHSKGSFQVETTKLTGCPNGLLPVCPSSEHNLMGAFTCQCPRGEQFRRYSSVTVCRGVCLTRLEETQI